MREADEGAGGGLVDEPTATPLLPARFLPPEVAFSSPAEDDRRAIDIRRDCTEQKRVAWVVVLTALKKVADLATETTHRFSLSLRDSLWLTWANWLRALFVWPSMGGIPAFPFFFLSSFFFRGEGGAGRVSQGNFLQNISWQSLASSLLSSNGLSKSNSSCKWITSFCTCVKAQG